MYNIEDRPTDRPTLHFVKFRTAISRQRVIRSTSSLVLGKAFRGRRIEWAYLRLDQIQDGGWPPSWKISNDHNSGISYPIHFHELQSSLEEQRTGENNARGVIIDWSQSKIFLVWFTFFVQMCTCMSTAVCIVCVHLALTACIVCIYKTLLGHHTI